jgi:hypothetical protein
VETYAHGAHDLPPQIQQQAALTRQAIEKR